MFTSIFGYGPGSGSETLELRIRIRQKFRILADPDPQHWLKHSFLIYSTSTVFWAVPVHHIRSQRIRIPKNDKYGGDAPDTGIGTYPTGLDRRPVAFPDLSVSGFWPNIWSASYGTGIRPYTESLCFPNIGIRKKCLKARSLNKKGIRLRTKQQLVPVPVPLFGSQMLEVIMNSFIFFFLAAIFVLWR
jgi:hypothetical protein